MESKKSIIDNFLEAFCYNKEKLTQEELIIKNKIEDLEISRILSDCDKECEFKHVGLRLTFDQKEERLISFLRDLEKDYQNKSQDHHYIAEYYLDPRRDKYKELLKELESYLNRNEIPENTVDIFTEEVLYKIVRVKDQVFKFKMPRIIEVKND